MTILNHAIIRNGVIVNVVVLDEKDTWPIPGETAIAVPAGIGIGDTYNGTTFVPKQQPVVVPVKSETQKLKELLVSKGVLQPADVAALSEAIIQP